MRGVPLLGLLFLAAAGANAVAVAASLPTASQKVTTASVAATIAPTTCALTAAADTYADESLLTSGTNYGSTTTLDVRSFRTAGLISENRRAFVRFDVESCAIPAGARIKTASLDLHLAIAPAAGRTYDVHRVDSAWTEPALTWSAQPSWSATATGSFSADALGARSTNVTSDVSSFLTGTANNGWVIKDRSENSATSQQGSFNSDEAPSQRPALVIGYYP